MSYNTKAANRLRKERGEKIVETSRIQERNKGGYVVPSQSGNGAYIVNPKEEKCECPDYESRHDMGVKCKHLFAVEIKTKKTVHEDGTVEIEKTVKETYSQDWSSYNTAQQEEKTRFLELLSDLVDNVEEPEREGAGRKPTPLRDMVYASALKVYSGFSLRRFTSDMEMAHNEGYIENTPSYSTVSRHMDKEEMTDALLNLIQLSSAPLAGVETEFAVDSSGFSTSRFEQWNNFKHGREESRRIWIKAHIMCGVNTNTVTAAKLTEQHGGDAPQFTDLVDMTNENFHIEEVSADKAYSSRENHNKISDLGGEAYIPFTSKATDRANGSFAWKRMYHKFQAERQEFEEHYHKRSNVETTFHMIKTKFGDSVNAKNQTAQMNEALLKILCHNIVVVIHEMEELGINPEFSQDKKPDLNVR